MKKPTVHLTVLAITALGSMTLLSPVWAATPMVGCSTGMLFMADQGGQPQPNRYELVSTLTHLPGVVPLVTTDTGYDYCVRYQRHQIDDTLAPLDTGTLSVTVYKLNERERWRKIAKIANVPVRGNEARRCKNVKKPLEVGATVRWVFQLGGLPELDLFDMYELEAAIFTGGAGELIATGSLSTLALDGGG